MPRKVVLIIVAVLLALGTLPVLADNPGSEFGIVDQWEKGCVSCHSPDDDGETLNTLLEEFGHADISRFVNELPSDCTMCHRDGTLGPIVHKSHFPEDLPADAPTMPCLACHRMNPATGVSENKTAPKNW